jgi:hypothetical protein
MVRAAGIAERSGVKRLSFAYRLQLKGVEVVGLHEERERALAAPGDAS